MTKEFKLQDPGEGIHEAEILEVQVAEGDDIAEGDTVLAIQTDKAAVDVPAPFTGTIESVEVQVGDMVHVGDVLMTYTEAGEAATEEKEEEAEEEAAEAKEADEAAAEEQAGAEEEEEDAAAEPETDGTEEEEEEAPKQAPQAAEDQPVPAAPSTRRLARELGVDLTAVAPSGPNGRVTAEDVRAAAEGAPAEEAEPAEAAPEEAEAEAPETEEAEAPAPEEAAPTPKLPDFSQWGEVERVPLQGIRRATARQMTRAWQQVPHVTHQDVADITELEHFRQAHKDTLEAEGGTLSLTVLMLKAVVAALKEFPRFNASLDPEAEEVILKQYYHVGVAVDTDDGLIVPVVRDVDRKSIAELAQEFEALIERTRSGEASPEDLEGASFTLTNPGPLGGKAFTPMINYPEVAILGMARAALEPVVQGDLDDYEIVPRLRLPLCLSFDHRVNDGADAARFVSRIVELVQDPEAFLLSV